MDLVVVGAAAWSVMDSWLSWRFGLLLIRFPSSSSSSPSLSLCRHTHKRTGKSEQL